MDIREEYALLSQELFSGTIGADEKNAVLIKLADLFFVSLDTFEHDVTDGIELCIVNEGTEKIIPYLENLKAGFLGKKAGFPNKDDFCVESIDFWIKKIRNP